MSEAGKTFEEMARIVDESPMVEFHEWLAADREWEADQREKARPLLGLLRRHLPVHVLQEAEELLSTKYGCKCIFDLLEREKKRRALREERPGAESEEIESFLDSGVWRSKDELVERRAELETMIGRREFPILPANWPRE